MYERSRKVSRKGSENLDKHLLEALYHRYYKELYIFVYSLCGSETVTDDILQDTFLKALLALKDSHTNMRAWLYMVARNLFYNQQKKKSREILTEVQDYFPEKKTEENLLEKFLKEEKRRILYQAIRRLDIKKREVIQLQYFGGMSQKEIAAVLHITPENVRVLAYRAKKDLKKYMEESEKSGSAGREEELR